MGTAMTRLVNWNAMKKRPAFFGQEGFTLIELMIVAAIIAVLALIAYPSYQDSVRKGRRGDAKSNLVQIAQALERCYTANGSYGLLCAGVTTGPDALAPNLSQSPQTGNPVNYTIVMQVPAGGTARSNYVLIATAQGDQVRDSCGNLSLDSTGAKTPIAGATGIACW